MVHSAETYCLSVLYEEHSNDNVHIEIVEEGYLD